MVSDPLIVVIGFNRPKALTRLLSSIDRAHFEKRATLVISLDGGAQKSVIDTAQRFSSDLLDIRVIIHQTHLGLRQHVLACGDLALDSGSIIVLEDDLVVDRYFFEYARHAVDFYANENSVAGVALYCYEQNEFVGLPFSPMRNGYSTFSMQVPCSWGQVWTRSQWLKFREWLAISRQNTKKSDSPLPPAVHAWPESSWKKLFFQFLVETDRVFVYPYQSLTTNCSDVGGTHIKAGTDLLQVELPNPYRKMSKWRFVPAANRDVFYDAFMEPVGEFVFQALGKQDEDICVDLYRSKPRHVLNQKRFLLTTGKTCGAIKTFPISFRPIEMNLLFPSEQNDGAIVLVETRHDIRETSARDYKELRYWAGYEIVSFRNLVALAREVLSRVVFRVTAAFQGWRKG